MKPERILLGFNVLLYCINGVLWQVFAHSTGLAIVSVAIAIGSAAAMKMTAED